MELSEQSFLILSALAAQPRHGYALIREVPAMTGGQITLRAGTLYRALGRLTGQDLVRADREEVENSRLRRYHALTDVRVKALRVRADRMEAATRVAPQRLPLRARFGGAA